MYPMRGIAFFFEAKAGRDTLKPAQSEFLASARACRISSVVGNLDDFLAHLRTENIVLDVRTGMDC
jgi:hypothetical protein